MAGFLLSLVVVGLIAGFVARALVPGRDAMGVVATIVLGVVGSFLGGFLGDVVSRGSGEERTLEPAGLIGSVFGAILALPAYNAIARRRAVHR